MLALEAFAPRAIDVFGSGLIFTPRQSIRVQPIAMSEFRGVVTYGTRNSSASNSPNPSIDDTDTAFRFSSRQTKITQAISVKSVTRDPSYSGGNGNLRNVIGVTSDGIQGLDIDISVFSFTKSAQRAHALVSNAWIRELGNLINYAPVNNEPFADFAAGEVRIIGASGSRRGNGNWRIDYEFAFSPNATDVGIGGDGTTPDLVVPVKDGWDYLDITYQKIFDNDLKLLVEVPVIARVMEIYRRSSFGAVLGFTQ